MLFWGKAILDQKSTPKCGLIKVLEHYGKLDKKLQAEISESSLGMAEMPEDWRVASVVALFKK